MSKTTSLVFRAMFFYAGSREISEAVTTYPA
jgi:hypothetical protein